MKKASYIFVLAAFIVAASLYIADSMATRSYLSMERASERYIAAQQSEPETNTPTDT